MFTKDDGTFRFNFLAALVFPFRAIGTVLYVAFLFFVGLFIVIFANKEVFITSDDELKAPEKINGRCASCYAAAATGVNVMRCENCSVVTAAA